MSSRFAAHASLRAGVLCAALTVAFQSGCSEPSAAVSRTPEQVIDAFYAELQSGNAAAALSLLSRDALIVEMGKTDRMRRDYATTHLPGDIEIAARARRELVSRRVGGAGDTRWVASTYRELDTRSDAKPTTVGETAVLRQVADRWQIVHLHWSNDTAQPATR